MKLESRLPELSDLEIRTAEGHLIPKFQLNASNNGSQMLTAFEHFLVEQRTLFAKPEGKELTQTLYPAMIEHFLNTLLDYYDHRKLTDNDLGRIFEVLLYSQIYSNIPSGNLEAILETRTKTSKAIRYLFGTEKMRRNFPMTAGAGSTLRPVYNRLLTKIKMGDVCEFIYR